MNDADRGGGSSGEERVQGSSRIGPLSLGILLGSPHASPVRVLPRHRVPSAVHEFWQTGQLLTTETGA